MQVAVLEPGEEVKIRNWTKFQHYKHRKPPWIRLYRELLEDPAWVSMADASKAVLCELWMVASDTEDGSLPASNVLAWRLRRDEYDLCLAISNIDSKFLEGASNVLAECKQHATTEKRREELQRRVEGETEGHRTETDLSNDSEVDTERDELDVAESHLLRTLVTLQKSGADVQAICDQIGRDTKRTPFGAHRALVGGKSGIPRTSDGLTVRLRLIDALEARQRAQDTPILSENNRRTFDAADRVLARMVAKRDGKELPREIEG